MTELDSNRSRERGRRELPMGSLSAAPLQAAAKRAQAPVDSILPALLLTLLAVMIVYIPNQAQFRIETGIRGVNVVNILFVLAFLVMTMIERKPSEPTPLKLSFALFFGVLVWAEMLALLGDSTAWVEDLTVFKNSVFYLLLYFLFFHAVRDMKTVRILMLVLLFVVITSTILGIRQAIDYGIGNFNENKRVAAPFGWEIYDANRSAVFFCIFLQPVGAAVLFLRSKLWLRLVCALVFGAGVFVVFHTYSRQAYFIVAVLVLLIALRKHLFVAFLACLALYHYEAWVPQTVIERIEMTQVDPFELKTYRPALPAFDSPTSYGPLYGQITELQSANPFRHETERAESNGDDRRFDESTESRFTLWAGGWELIQRHPFGIGMNRFKREITPHVPHTLAGKDAHNFYVLLTTEAGVVAPVALLLLLFGLLAMGQRLARMADDQEARTIGMGFVMAVLAVVLGNVYGSRFLDGDVMGNFWIFTALAARTLLLKESERHERERRRLTAKRPGSAAARPWIRPAAASHAASRGQA